MEAFFGKERAEILAEYVVENGATVRQTAARFGVSKSTVHKDITAKLQYINPALYKSAQQILRQNKAERHLRGGEATRRKYLCRKKGARKCK